MKKQYITDSFVYKLFTYEPRNEYFTSNIVKFSVTEKPTKIVYTTCHDFSLFNEEWDIYVLWIHSKKINAKDKSTIEKIFSHNIPLYPVFSKNYIVITKIISKQIFQLADKCEILDILDLYLYEFGAVLTDIVGLHPFRKFRGTDYPIIWKVDPDDVKHIVPKMHGWFDKSTQLIVDYVLRTYNYSTIVELGSWYGKSTCFILENMKDGTNLYCFDKFQNIANSPYDFSEKTPIDNFYFQTPRYETFYKNVSKYVTSKKKCHTIKYDVRHFMKVLHHKIISPNIIFIDAIKKSRELFAI